MTDTPEYTPPEVWVWEKDDSPKWRYGEVNRPIAGATHEKELARGKHPLQLYSLATPNGVKVTIMLEELLAAGHSGAEYDAWLIRIGEGHQFGSGFVGVNPNSKIPALMDYSQQTPQRVFESGAILLYLADKFGTFLPKDRGKRTEGAELAVLADWFNALCRRRLRAFLCLCSGEDQIRHRPFHDGGEAPARRARPAACGQSVHRRRRIYDRRYGYLAVVRQRYVERRLIQRPAQVPTDARI